MATINQSAPGIYSQVTNSSFLPEALSSFSAGLIGVASKGSFDVAVPLATYTDAVSNFGAKIDANHLMLETLALVTPNSNATYAVRVGARYKAATANNASGNAAQPSGAGWTAVIVTPQSNLISTNDYVRITQTGKATTVNAQVFGVSGSNVQLNSSLADNYTAAIVERSTVVNAANKAEGFAQALTYTSVSTFTAAGTKSGSVLYVTGAPTSGTNWNGLLVGSTIKIVQAGKNTTREAIIQSFTLGSNGAPGIIQLQTTTQTSTGQQPVHLQDNYTSATIYLATVTNGALVQTPTLYVQAINEGTWANTTSAAGVSVTVQPGSADDSKCLVVYYNGTAVESIDNLTFINPADANYASTRINGFSSYITVNVLSNSEPPANTVNGWASANTVNVVWLANGFNGENALLADYIGTIDPATDLPTGLQVYSVFGQQLGISEIACTDVFDSNSSYTIAIANEAAAIGLANFALYEFSCPVGITLRQCTDWMNGVGLYAGIGGKIDNYAAAVFWNTPTITDPLDGTTINWPPHLASLVARATYSDATRPWYAMAGLNRGVVTYGNKLAYEYVNEPARQAAYGNGNSINPLIRENGVIEIDGNRTLARQESKLTAINNVMLVFYIVRNLQNRGKKYKFEPNDPTLLSEIYLDFKGFMDAVQNGRGVESYSLIIDGSNNNATTRNNRLVNVGLQVIPTDAMERMFIRLAVMASGAQLYSVTATPPVTPLANSN